LLTKSLFDHLDDLVGITRLPSTVRHQPGADFRGVKVMSTCDEAVEDFNRPLFVAGMRDACCQVDGLC
jgi:hypothetical protein